MKRALVTGGSKGIGLSIVLMLLQEGYHVTATFAHDATAIEKAFQYLCEELQIEVQTLSQHLRFVRANNAERSDMLALTHLLKSEEKLDCVVLNAGTTNRASLSTLTDEDWHEVMEVNLNSNVFLLRDLFEHINFDSRIIFIGSQMAIHPHGLSLVYGVSKAALHALTKNLVKVFESLQTTVNCIAPGFTETEWQKQKSPTIRQNICAKTAIHRFAQPSEIADAVRFCLNNAFVNGSILEIHGGYNYQ